MDLFGEVRYAYKILKVLPRFVSFPEAVAGGDVVEVVETIFEVAAIALAI